MARARAACRAGTCARRGHEHLVSRVAEKKMVPSWMSGRTNAHLLQELRKPLRCARRLDRRRGRKAQSSPESQRARPLSDSCFRDETACSVDVLLTRCAAPGWADRCRGYPEPMDMVTDRVFPKKEVGGPSWVTLGPQFAMKACSDATKASPIARARA